MRKITPSIMAMRQLSIVPEEDVEMADITRAYIPSQRALDMMDTTADYESFRGALHGPISIVRPPGSLFGRDAPGLTNRILRSMTPSYNVSPDIQSSGAPVDHIDEIQTRNTMEGSSNHRRQATPGPSNYRRPSFGDYDPPYNFCYSTPNLSTNTADFEPLESQDAHANSTESQALSDPVAKAIISGMDKMVQKLNAIHEDFSNTPRTVNHNSRSRASPSPFKDQSSRRPRETEYNFLMVSFVYCPIF